MKTTLQHLTLGLLLGILLELPAVSQTYSFQQNAVTFTPISNGTLLAENWVDTSWETHIGFPFEFFGNTYDSVAIDGRGYLSFKEDDSEILYGFGAEMYGASFLGSKLSYELTGSPGNQTFIVEYLNTTFVNGTFWDSLDMQIVLYESTGDIRINYGHSADQYTTYSNGRPLVGVVNTNTMTGFTLTGNPSSPTIDPLLGEINGVPAYGTQYAFAPVLTTSIEESLNPNNMAVYPNPTVGLLNIQDAEKLQKLKIISPTGHIIFCATGSRIPDQINTSEWFSGTYMLYLVTQHETSTYRINKL